MRTSRISLVAFLSLSVFASTPGWATRIREALERFNLIELELRHVYMPKPGDCSSPVAVFFDEDDYAYDARVGSYVGKNDGRILSITADDVVIEEIHKIKGEYQLVRLTLHPQFKARKTDKPGPAPCEKGNSRTAQLKKPCDGSG